jgi:hypothetical protein
MLIALLVVLLSQGCLTVPVVLYGCATWCLTLRAEHRLKVPTALRSLFGPKTAGSWRKLHSEELRNLYCSGCNKNDKSGKMKWAGHVALVGEKWNGCRWQRQKKRKN